MPITSQRWRLSRAFVLFHKQSKTKKISDYLQREKQQSLLSILNYWLVFFIPSFQEQHAALRLILLFSSENRHRLLNRNKHSSHLSSHRQQELSSAPPFKQPLHFWRFLKHFNWLCRVWQSSGLQLMREDKADSPPEWMKRTEADQRGEWW